MFTVAFVISFVAVSVTALVWFGNQKPQLALTPAAQYAADNEQLYLNLPESAQEAVNEFRRLGAMTEVGVSRDKYTEAFGEAYGSFKVFKAADAKNLQLLVEMLERVISGHTTTMKAYESADKFPGNAVMQISCKQEIQSGWTMAALYMLDVEKLLDPVTCNSVLQESYLKSNKEVKK